MKSCKKTQLHSWKSWLCSLCFLLLEDNNVFLLKIVLQLKWLQICTATTGPCLVWTILFYFFWKLRKYIKLLRNCTRVYFSRDYIFCRGDRYVLAYICAKNLNLIIWHLLHMCYPNKNRFILIFSLLTYCANLCLQFANLCLQFRVIIFRQIFDSALPWAVCCAGVLFI